MKSCSKPSVKNARRERQVPTSIMRQVFRHSNNSEVRGKKRGVCISKSATWVRSWSSVGRRRSSLVSPFSVSRLTWIQIARKWSIRLFCNTYNKELQHSTLVVHMRKLQNTHKHKTLIYKEQRRTDPLSTKHRNPTTPTLGNNCWKKGKQLTNPSSEMSISW
jgi:hypothetical protein